MNRQLYDEASSDNGGWITTFADLMTLLLVFFILMFSMSSVKEDRFREVMAAIQLSLEGPGMPISHGSLSGEGGQSANNSLMEFPASRQLQDASELAMEKTEQPSRKLQTQPAVRQGDEQWQLMANTLRSRLARRNVEDKVRVSLPRDGVIAVQVQGAILFDSGSSYLNFEADQVMDTLYELFRDYSGYTINIKGHTDNIPIATDRYESNWELSAIRATTVLRYFVSRGISARRLTATGYGDSLPIASNNDSEGRTKNRRIEFVLERQTSRTVN